MGCGRVGILLTQELSKAGHEITVIDKNAAAFARLPPGFEARTIVGLGFDRDVLEDAGIKEADAFLAVSSGDNSNILSARVARETYHVPKVIARIYDPMRADQGDPRGRRPVPDARRDPDAPRRQAGLLAQP